jgi:streptomycin 3"-adenylyltransferase
MRTSPPVEIARQLSSACEVIERNLAGTLQAIHLFGSAVDRGLKLYSDIDLLVTISGPLAESVRRSLMMDLLSISAWPGTSETYRALEVTVIVREEVVPWRYPPMRELQFGEWLREQLRTGIIQSAIPDHDLAILLTKVRQRSVCLVGTPASELFDPVPKESFVKALSDTTAQWNEEPDWQGDERNVVLALARIWFSVSTGEIAPKDVAASWVLERLPHEYRAVLMVAQAAYLGTARDDLAERTKQVASFVCYTKEMIERICSSY